MIKPFYVTSPIYYVNDKPHIGHAYTSVACDCLARFQKLDGYDVKFLTGVDEHGQKVEKSAKDKKIDTQEFCDQIAQSFIDLTKFLNLSNDDFIRTTQTRHKDFAQKFWQKLADNGWIYKGVYEGWYAMRDEAFYSEDEIVDGRAPSGAEVSWEKQESYFFKLSGFEEILLKSYEALENFIAPKSKLNEVKSFVTGGLKDLSISRNTFSWGIKVPDDENHIMYVWLDALTNYLSALENDDNRQAYWQNVTHIIGKDILRFHAVYWPAFLIAANFENLDDIKIEDLKKYLPNKIFAHGWWTNEGQKISKSIGNIIDPYQEIKWLEEKGANEDVAIDYFRFFLMRQVPFGSDGNYVRENFIFLVNSSLANNIGNLTQRVLSMIYKNCDAKIPQVTIDDEGQKLLDFGYKIIEKNRKILSDNLAFDSCLEEICTYGDMANNYIDKKAPWNLKKSVDEKDIAQFQMILYVLSEAIRILAINLQPFTPNLASKMLDALKIDQNQRNFANLSNDFALRSGVEIEKPQGIFPRLV